MSVPRATIHVAAATALHVLSIPHHCTGLILGVSVTHAWPASPCSARVPEMLGWAQTGHRSRGCAHAEVFRKPGTTMFWRLVYDLLPSGEWWDTIPADSVSDRWGARKFTIGQRGAVKGPAPSSLTNPAAAARPRRVHGRGSRQRCWTRSCGGIATHVRPRVTGGDMKNARGRC